MLVFLIHGRHKIKIFRKSVKSNVISNAAKSIFEYLSAFA